MNQIIDTQELVLSLKEATEQLLWLNAQDVKASTNAVLDNCITVLGKYGHTFEVTNVTDEF